MMYKEVCYLLLLQIGVQGHLNYKASICQHLDEVKTWGLRLLPSKEEEGRSIKMSVWNTAATED